MSAHARIVSHLRDVVARDGHKLAKHLTGFTDEQVYHKLFQNYRGKKAAPRGLRLTWLGFQLLSSYFRPYEVPIPDDYKLGTLDLLYLDHRAQMPYYIARGEEDNAATTLYVFEAKLAIILKLADCMVSNLRDMES
jgi:hypothetical protein